MTLKGLRFFITSAGISMTSSLIQLFRMLTFSPGRSSVQRDHRKRSCSERATPFMTAMASVSVCQRMAGRGVTTGGANTLLTLREAL